MTRRRRGVTGLVVALAGCVAGPVGASAALERESGEPGEAAGSGPSEAASPASEPEPEPEPEPEFEPSPVERVEGGGGLDGEAIRAVVRAHVDAVRACYALRPELDAAIVAAISISFTIGPTGAVTEAHADVPADFPAPELPACIVAELRTWVFPAPAGGGSVIVSYPR